MARGAPQKKFEQYLENPPTGTLSMSDYVSFPAVAFLKSVCEAHDAFAHCMNKFTTKKNGAYYKDSKDSLHQVGVALVATTMGHFETYQKGLFAGLLERSRHFEKFDEKLVSKGLGDPQIDLPRFFSYLGAAAPVGLTTADALRRWHCPSAVNGYFQALGVKRDAYSTADKDDLTVLWQLRHSIVHTAGWLTLPDAQKVARLSKHGDQAVAFKDTFVAAMARKLHKVVKNANRQLLEGATAALGTTPDPNVVSELGAFLEVKSPKPTWL